MSERVALFRPLTRELLHPEIQWLDGEDSTGLSAPGSMMFTVPARWEEELARDGAPVFGVRSTLAVVERPNGSIRNAGLVDGLNLRGNTLEVSCGGLAMLPGQSGPWEGDQGWYTVKDALELFYEVWEQTQSYANSNVGVRVVGDRRSGVPVGDTGSARWRSAQREHKKLLPAVERLEASVLTHERVLSQREERMFRLAGLKRVGRVTVAEARPDDPGYEADSTLWIRESDRLAHRWYNGRWNANRNANEAVAWWFTSTSNLEKKKAELAEAKYRIEPLEDVLARYEGEEREEFGLYFWQNHNMGETIENLMDIGSFEFREEAAWNGDDLDLMIRAGAPKVGVKRDEIHLELGRNILDHPPVESQGEFYTGLALFGAGEGSEVLAEQRNWDPKHAVRRILTETDKDALTRSMTRAAANRLEEQTRKDSKFGITEITIHHDEACPEGLIQVGDEIFINGTYVTGRSANQWARVVTLHKPWGVQQTRAEVVPV